MGMIKDRNSKDLTETEEIKKRWQKYTEVLYKKGLNNFDNNNGVVTNLELYIIKCEFKWALGKIIVNKVSGCDGIPAELFQILKKKKKRKILLTCFIQYVSKFRKLSRVCRNRKCPFFFSSQVRAMPKRVQTAIQLHLFHTLSKLCSKSFKLGFGSR